MNRKIANIEELLEKGWWERYEKNIICIGSKLHSGADEAPLVSFCLDDKHLHKVLMGARTPSVTSPYSSLWIRQTVTAAIVARGTVAASTRTASTSHPIGHLRHWSPICHSNLVAMLRTSRRPSPSFMPNHYWLEDAMTESSYQPEGPSSEHIVAQTKVPSTVSWRRTATFSYAKVIANSIYIFVSFLNRDRNRYSFICAMTKWVAEPTSS